MQGTQYSSATKYFQKISCNHVPGFFFLCGIQSNTDMMTVTAFRIL